MPPLTLTLQRLPLPIPQLAAVFRHSLGDLDKASDQRVFLTTDSQSAPFIASLSECINFVSRLTGTVNKIISVAATVGQNWTDFLELATGLGALAYQIGNIDPSYVFFQPCLNTQPSPCINLSSTSSFNNSISAVIVVGPPTTHKWIRGV